MQSTQMQERKLARDEFSLKKTITGFGDMARYLSSKWLILAAFALFGAVIGIGYAMSKKVVYKAVSTFVLEDSEKGGGSLGQYSALASIVGIDVGTSSGLFQGDNIIELYKSRKMLEMTLLTPIGINDKNEFLIDRYLKMKKLDEAWKDNEKLKLLNFHVPKERFTVLHDSVMSLVVDDLNKNHLIVGKPDKKLSIISVEVKATDPQFAKTFTNTIVNNVNAFYVKTKTKGLATNLALLKKQADSVRRVLNVALGGAAAALESFPNANPLMQQSLRVPSQRRQIDVQAASAIYAEVVKNLEIAKSSLQRETPLIQIIDEPVLPLPNDRLGKSKAGMMGIFIALVIGIIFLIGQRGYQSIMA